jgi:hypothetical protein
MKSVCLVSYYGLKETLLLASNALQTKNIKIYDFPLFKYMHDSTDKVINYVELFVNYIKDNNIEIVLWWFINIPTFEFIEIKKISGTKYAFFNWDEPYNWKCCDIINKMSYFDAVFVTCKDTLNVYRKYGCNEAYCLYPGYDINTNYPIKNTNTNESLENRKKYECDISFCCTNLYDDNKLYPFQYVNRKKIIDDIYNGQKIHNYIFHIYGPESFKDLYPMSYRGFAKYDDLNKIFNYSKINLCTHVISSAKGYLNERIFLIGGSGGLVLCDYVSGIEDIFELNEEILIFDKYFYVNQISKILENYDKYQKCRINIQKKCIKQYSYDSWSTVIANVIHKLL